MFALQWYDFVGFLGVFLVLGAFAGQQSRRIDGHGELYSLLNLIGAGGILVPVLYAERMNWSVLLIEGAWMAISLVGLWTALRARFRPRPCPR